MPRRNLYLAGVGLLIVIAAAADHLFPKFLPAIRIGQVARNTNNVEISSTYQALTAGPYLFDEIEIKISYRAQIQSDETLNVTAELSQIKHTFEAARSQSSQGPISTDPPPGIGPLNTLLWPVQMTLSGAAFKIEPKQRSVPKGTAIPTSLAWTALADTTGKHVLLFDWSGAVPPGPFWVQRSAISKVLVNDQPANAGDKTISLPVEVVTKWGIPQTTADIVQWSVAFVGFIFTLPLIGGLWPKRDGKIKITRDDRHTG